MESCGGVEKIPGNRNPQDKHERRQSFFLAEVHFCAAVRFPEKIARLVGFDEFDKA
jgi:hypothetical protein